MILYIIIFVLLLRVAYKLLKPKRCYICNNLFKRTYYKWTLEGKKRYLCPLCSDKMDKKISKERFEDKYS